MNRVERLTRLGALGSVALLAGSGPALAAPTLRTTVLPIYQIGSGAGVSLGHVVVASTVYNRLTAGGTYTASCASSQMMPATGQRFLSSDGITGGRSLTVTVPEWVPATVNMPGFTSLTRGSTVTCTYNWTSRAVEGGYTYAPGGISFQTGNGERSEGSTQPFQMSVPGDTNTEDWQGCIP
jgi:hypothetical protein